MHPIRDAEESGPAEAEKPGYAMIVSRAADVALYY